MTNWLAAIILATQLIRPMAGPLPLRSLGTAAVRAQIEIIDEKVDYQFGQQVSFQAQITSSDPIQSAVIYITPAGQSTSWYDVQVLPGNKIDQSLDASQLSLRPFSLVKYRYQINLANGQSENSAEFSFQYDDNRFDWDRLGSSDFEVFWYGRDPAFGQEVLNVAHAGVENARSILDSPVPSQLNIYVYASSRDLQDALLLNNQPWVAGHASPDLDQVMISIPSGPEQKLELERQLPHEIMHILQYQQIGQGFQRQPVWLLEGMASIAELYPNPDYQYVLTTSAANQDLLPIETLCTRFPREAAGTYLAYAESESFVRFLYQNYGSSSLLKLIQRYQDGLGCEEGFLSTFGFSLGQMEYRWKQEVLGMDAAGLAMKNLSPYLIMMGLLLIPVVLALLPLMSRKAAMKKNSPPQTHTP